MPDREALPRQNSSDEIRAAAEAAAAVFRVRGWTWGGAPWGREKHAPDADEIEATLWCLAGNLKGRDEGVSSATGRLYVQVGDDGDLHLSIDLGTLEGFYAEEVSGRA